MKKLPALTAAVLAALSLAACGAPSEPQGGDVCPGKQAGADGVPVTTPQGFDENEDMSFTTVDTQGNAVTNEVFAGSERGVWLMFWQTGIDRSRAALEQLERLLPEAEKNGYKVIGVVMDGGEHSDKAAEMTEGLHFTNLVWNDEMAARYDGIEAFFDGSRYEQDEDVYLQMSPRPDVGDPVSTRANSRGQIQTSCTLVPLSDEQIVSRMERFDSDMTYEEALAENEKYLNQ